MSGATDPDRRSVTYAFCLLRRSESPTVEDAPDPPPALAAVRVLRISPSHPIWLVVATAPRTHYDADAVAAGLEDLDWVSRCGIAHEQIVEFAMKQGAVIPLKLFTLFDDDERASSYFAGMRERLEPILERVTGCQEWGLHVTLGPRRPHVASSPSEGADASGAGYLLRKKAGRDRAHQQTSVARQHAEELYARLSERAVSSHRRPSMESEIGSRVLLDAAFLVATPEAERFERDVRAMTDELKGEGLTVRLSGPWPPYNFVEEGE